MKPIDLARLFLLAALWGGSYLFIRIAAPVLGVFFTISLRIILAVFALSLSGTIASRSKLKSRWQSYLLLGLFGNILLGEPVNSGLIFGLIIILLSVWLVINPKK